MSMYTDADIKQILTTDEEWADKNKLNIFPYLEASLTPVGYDLRVGDLYASLKKGKNKLKEKEKIEILPGDMVLIRTLENVRMPRNRILSGLIESKVSCVSKGLSHISTTVDPDWKGRLLIAIHNHSICPLKLEYGMAFCTLCFLSNKSPSLKDCSKPDDRPDAFADFIDRAYKNAKYQEKLKEEEKAKRDRDRKNMLIAVWTIIIMVSIALGGYFFMGNSAGFISITSLGIAISSVITVWLKLKEN